MKTILVPTAAHDLMESVLETALLAARRFDAYLEGFAIRPLITEYVPVDSSHARVFDVTVLARPTSGHAEPSMATLEAVLFESGRPILIAPPTPPTKLGDTIAIAWNGSTETARATA